MKIRNWAALCLSIALLCGALCGNALAATDRPEEVAIVRGTSKILTLTRDVARIAIGNPKIATVMLLDSQQILINAGTTGRTNLICWYDARDIQEFQIVVELDLRYLREHLKRLDPEIEVETSSDGIILLRGFVATFETMRAAMDVAATYLSGNQNPGGVDFIIQSPESTGEKPALNPDGTEATAFGDVPKLRNESTFSSASQGTTGLKFLVSNKVRNLLIVRELPDVLEKRLQLTVSEFDKSLKISRIQGGAQASSSDTFKLDGVIPSVVEYVRMLTILDALLKGKGTFEQPDPSRQDQIIQVGDEKNKLLSYVRVTFRATELQDRLQEVANEYSDNVKVKRLSPGNAPDDKKDTFFLYGTVETQQKYVKLMTIMDRLLGGTGTGLSIVADESGAIGGGSGGGGGTGGGTGKTQNTGNGGQSNSQQGTGGGGGVGGGGTNFGKALIVRNGNNRLISYLKLVNIPQVMIAVRLLELDRSKSKERNIDITTLNRDTTLGYSRVFQTPSDRGPRVGDRNQLLNPFYTGSNTLTQPVDDIGDPVGDPIRGRTSYSRPISPHFRGTQSDIQNIFSTLNGAGFNQFSLIADRFNFTAQISFLEGNGYIRTLAEPNLFTISGQPATFQVGGEVPVLSLNNNTGTNLVTQTFEYKEFGIRLTALPLVAEDGMVTLTLNPQITDRAGNDGTTIAPLFNTKRVTTEVILRSGEGVVIGGLIAKSEVYSRQYPPILGKIPLIGQYFGQKTRRETEQELAMIAFPQIMYPKPANFFALEPPPGDFKIKPGTFLNPESGDLPYPAFHYKNVGEGDALPQVRQNPSQNSFLSRIPLVSRPLQKLMVRDQEEEFGAPKDGSKEKTPVGPGGEFLPPPEKGKGGEQAPPVQNNQ